MRLWYIDAVLVEWCVTVYVMLAVLVSNEPTKLYSFASRWISRFHVFAFCLQLPIALTVSELSRHPLLTQNVRPTLKPWALMLGFNVGRSKFASFSVLYKLAIRAPNVNHPQWRSNRVCKACSACCPIAVGREPRRTLCEWGRSPRGPFGIIARWPATTLLRHCRLECQTPSQRLTVRLLDGVWH